MVNNKLFKQVLSEMARGLMFSKGHIKAEVEPFKAVAKPVGCGDLKRVEQKCCVGRK